MIPAAREPVGSLTCSCAAGSSLTQRKEPDHWAARGEVSKNSPLAYLVPVATRERPAREGGARENPLCLRNTARMGHFLPLVTQPNRPLSVHTCTSIRHRHKHALEAKQAAYLKRTKSTKETQQASHGGGGGGGGEGAAVQVRAENAATHSSELTFPPPAPLNRPFKVGGRIKTDEGGSMSDTVRLRCRQPLNPGRARINTHEQK